MKNVEILNPEKDLNKETFSKIDLIVPYEDDLDYIKDYDGDYGINSAESRFDFEISPDGFHIVRPVSEINPKEIAHTEELFIRTANILANLLGINPKNRSLMKDVYFVVIAWYTITGYPISTLYSLVKSGYFKTIFDIEEFILFMDDFNTSDEVMAYLYDQYSEKPKKKFYTSDYDHGDSDYDFNDDEYGLDEDENEYTTTISSDFTLPLYTYDKEKEYSLLDRLHEIKKEIQRNLDPEKREELENERKAIIAKIYRMREEFLAEIGCTYKDYLLARREIRYHKNFGWVKYPIKVTNTEDPEIEKLLDELYEVNNTITRLKEAEHIYTDEESVDPEEVIKELMIRKKTLEKQIENLKSKKMTAIDKKVAEIQKLIEKVRNSGKKDTRKAIVISNKAYSKIKKIKDIGLKQALFSSLKKAWEERKKRIQTISINKAKTSKKQQVQYKH
ncbi:MAG: hypothetical protein QW472_01680 [Candidatus Aenigmatarchaeota archaeon]